MKKQFGKIFAVLAVAAILVLGIVAGRYWEAGKKPNLTAQPSLHRSLNFPSFPLQSWLTGDWQVQSGRNHLFRQRKNLP